MSQDYYQILGVPMDADSQAIKQAYRALARQYHPDTSNNANKLKFSEATEAYRTLIQPDRRAHYDQTLRQRWQVSAHTPPHYQQRLHTESNRPFVMILVGFLGFSLLMLLVMLVILLEFGPDKLSAEEVRQLQQAGSQVCKIDFARNDNTCGGLQAVRMIGRDLRIEAKRSLRLVIAPSDGWHLLLEDGTGPMIRVVDGSLIALPNREATPLMEPIAVEGDSLSLEWRHHTMLWRTEQGRGSIDSTALFSFPATFTLQFDA